MANGTRLTINDDQKGIMLLPDLRAMQNAKNPKDYTDARQRFLKSAARIGLTEAQVDALGKVVEQPGEVAALAIKTMISLAEKNASQLIELKRQWADAYMRQGNSIAGIASAARAIGAICSMFGADEFATMLNEKADAEMAKADIHFAKARTKMSEDTGATEAMRKSIADSLAVLTDKTPGHDISAATTTLALNAAQTKITNIHEAGSVRDQPAATEPSLDTTGRQKISWKQFQENMASAGIDSATQAKMQAIYDKNANFDATTKPGVVDSAIEGDKLVRGINKSDSLTATQKSALVSKLHLAAPELVPG